MNFTPTVGGFIGGGERVKLKDILNKCSYPVWVNVESPGRSWTYGEMNCDDKRLEDLRDYEVCYITTDVMGNLVIEVKEEE